ncbi:MAG: hypothetical protein IH593_14625, partial [Bacteroidales bacterium]|nr:hypothetical protein [Bacteroidales bacterium]
SKVDSTTFVIDSVILAIDDLNGTIDWEVSSDTLTWKSLQLDNDSLWIRIDSSAYYRAMLSVGTCFPVSSGIAKVGFKSIIVQGNSITLDPEGGVYIFSSGMKVIVPPGAVTEPMTITLNLLDSIGADLCIPFDADTGKVFCAGIYCEPSLPQLLKPIRIRLPAKNYTFADLPVVFQYDPVYGTWERYAGDFTCSESMQFIEYSTDFILSSRMVLIKDVFVYGKSSERSKLKGIDCRAILAKLETSAYDHLGQLASGECHVADDKLSVTFTACPGSPVETAHLREIGKSCKPSVVHDVKKCLVKGEQTAMSIIVTVGGFPLEKQRVVVGLPSGLSAPGLPLPLTFMTDENGNVTFIISCDVDKFAGTFTYNVYYEYPLTVIEASAGGVSAVHWREIVSGNISKSVRIECPYLDQILLISSCGPMKVPETCQLYPTCLDQFGNTIDCGNVEFIVTESLPSAGVISIGADGMLTCLTPGLAYIKA